MKKILTLTICIIIIGFNTANAQVFKKFDPVICPVDHNSYDTSVPPPEKFKAFNARGVKQNTADIIVNYNGFDDNEEAKIAYQYAVDIWASLIKSPVQIVVNANFRELGQGVLGSAGPTNFVRDFPGAVKSNTFYPIALAEKIAGYNLNTPGDADINSNFNSDFDFYFGLDADPPSGQYDFVSIVLHELGHGLGFTGATSFENGIGNWALNSNDDASIYTNFVELGDGTLITDIPSGTSEAGNAFTSNDLFFNGPISVSSLGVTPQLYAPSNWNGGSSYSHLDEAEYPAGDDNSLMSPQFGSGEAIHDPGISLDIFADMGWVHTYLNHENTNNVTNNLTDAFEINLSVSSDTGYNELNPVLVYSTDNFENSITVEMTSAGDNVNYTAEIPNPGVEANIKYYFEGVEDKAGRIYTAPSNAPNKFYEINILNFTTKTLPYELANGGDFESNENDFRSIILTGNENLWEYGQPGNVLNQTTSGDNVWKTKLSENIGPLNSSLSSALISPIFDFSDDTKNHELSFKFLMENAFTEANGLFSSGPFGLQVQFSLNEGQSWEILGEANDQRGTNWYNVEESSPSVFPIEENAGWIQQTIEVIDGDTTFIPTEARYNVSFLSGNDKVNFRFVFFVAQDYVAAGYEADGVLIDDFEITTSSPTADFVSSSEGLTYPGDEVNFEYISKGATAFEWNFGDGNTSTLENPSHIYTEGGTYDVSLTITSPDGTDTKIKEKLIKVVPSRQIPYTLEDGGNLEGENQDFSILNISGSGFSLGSSSIEGKAGTASGENAFVTAINDELYVDDSEAYVYTPEFEFTGIGNYEFSFETNYQFEDNWDGFIVEYTIDRGENWVKLNDEQEEGWYNQISDPLSVFGSEVPIFSGNTANEFEKKYTDVSFLGGEGKVSFRIKFLTDAATVDVGMAIDNIELSGPEAGPAIPDFIADIQSGCEGTVVTFRNESIGTIKDLEWNFGEGAEPQTASGLGPHEVVYNSEGNYNVSLTAEDFVGTSITEEKEAFISIGASHTPSITAGERSEDFTVLLTATEGQAYQWYMDGDTIPNATEQTYLAVEDAQYSVAVIINNCLGFSDGNNIITSNDSPLARSFSVFPNPLKNSKELNISFENEYIGDYSVEVYSLKGSKILSKKFNKLGIQEAKEMNLNNAIEGLYLVRVTTGNQSTQIKVLIE
ncbi:PKD domain-containing protein [Marivirga salinae]|uniref:PKD domain-containing protein n=1 Tax=Marivirga salinarum TaxID=3059078 RepID=A0AA51RCS7_9BACT|nr:PKD domain-containing protein [Marivirga sp. BDSF4-3]WMN12138.1 PKD domain-containing protein [Marivirga sp. BDSF4-3]